MFSLSSPVDLPRSRRTLGTSCFDSGSMSMMQPRSASTHSKINCMMLESSCSISSVWLTASAVRYMICKLLRARASQGFSAEPWAKMALPSSWGTDCTIREPAVAAALTICTRWPMFCGPLSPEPVNSITVRPSCT